MKNIKVLWLVALASLTMIGSTLPAKADFEDDLAAALIERLLENIADEIIDSRYEVEARQYGIERLELPLNDIEYRGDNIIYLKALLNQRYPGLRLADADLISVRLVAKTRAGRGQAELEVDGRTSDRVTVPGNPREFDIDLPRTFSRVDLDNGRRSEGTWQIHLHGNFKVRRVVVVARFGGNHGGGPGRGVLVSCDSDNYRFESCYVGFRIADVQLRAQQSRSACIYGRTWGFTSDAIWVDQGCAGTFLVTAARGPRGGLGAPRGGHGGHRGPGGRF